MNSWKNNHLCQWFLVQQPLVPMVFLWFCSPATIGHNGFSIVSHRFSSPWLDRVYKWENVSVPVRQDDENQPNTYNLDNNTDILENTNSLNGSFAILSVLFWGAAYLLALCDLVWLHWLHFFFFSRLNDCQCQVEVWDRQKCHQQVNIQMYFSKNKLYWGDWNQRR